MNENIIDFFRDINSYPEQMSSSALMCRIVDGIGFRYYWATFDLTESTYNFKPGIDRWSIYDTLAHIWDTADWISRSLGLEKNFKPVESLELRNSILEMYYAIRMCFHNMDDNTLKSITINKAPFWNLINGSLEDMLSHVGAIDNMRRTDGDLPIEPHYFFGTPPKK